MIPDIEFEYSPSALRDLKAYKKLHDAASLDRIREIQREIVRTWPEPEGLFSPERLRNGLTGHFSRRVNRKDRYVYSIDEENRKVYVVQCMGHYGDR